MSEAILKGKDGKELIMRKPNIGDHREGQKVYNNAFHDAVKSKAFVRAKLDDLLREQGLWTDEKEARYQAIKKEILEHELSLQKGGIKLSEAKAIAISMIKLRGEIRGLLIERTQLDNNTAEGQADNARFDYWVSVCLVYKDGGKPYFSSLDDYMNSTEDVAGEAARVLSNMIYSLDSDYESKLPEFRFLKKFHMVDEKLRFINKDGHLVDVDGNLMNENGRLVNEKNELVDREGNRVDEEGNYVVDEKPFLDDDGNAYMETTIVPVPALVEKVEVAPEPEPEPIV